MTRNRTLALVAAAVVAVAALTGSAAAAPGNSGAQDGGAQDDDEAGPSGDLPGPVPDFVEEIHAQIQAFIGGSVDDLGAAVSDVAVGERADTGGDERSSDDSPS